MDMKHIDERYIRSRFILLGMKRGGDAGILYQSDDLEQVVTYGIDEAFECADDEFEDEDYRISFLESLSIWDAQETVRLNSKMDDCINRIKSIDFPAKDDRVRYFIFYHPTISHHAVTNLIAYAEIENKPDLINMITEVIIADIKADLDNPSLAKDKVKEYYSDRYYSKFSCCIMVDKELLDKMEQLLDKSDK